MGNVVALPDAVTQQKARLDTVAER